MAKRRHTSPTGSVNQSRTATSVQALDIELALAPQLLGMNELNHSANKKEDGQFPYASTPRVRPGFKREYLKCDAAFAKTVGMRGGIAKTVGTVIHEGESKERGEWDEVALAYYPSIEHFSDG
ncbi:hypothetical protein DSL72_001706 [Monilinia vaccinii-corymbosi]|uniref:Uncharacterized protein n=1 Tax=Monilinia vaccinii-corymbosi TaxID=61207 RepID=A0A8A3PAP2_9HELO|nr:hypothetical protein DSL72_001706 [Monilinia vaccinii-corymbosi]